jgi:effector-binding domain-containing protein
MTTISEVRIDERPEKPYMGIRTQTPFKGMFAVVDRLRKELSTWLKEMGVEPAGPPFLRYHVIDMAGEMDVSYGVPVAEAMPDDGQVAADVLPAGRYASLIYMGHGLVGNKALLGWALDNDIPWDRWEDEKGDAFRARTETYLTDRQVEPRKTKWDIELAIKLADE